MHPRILALVAAPLLAVALGACAPIPPRGDVYYPGQTMRPQTVEPAFIEGVRPVQLAGVNTGVGTFSGATIGSIAGSTMGGSYNANAVGAIVGFIIGGLVGTAVEQGATQRPGLELTVRLDSGRLLAIIQDDAGEAFRAGERVRVISDGYLSRVVR
jgi:outer membrane lipoprotein SlyB